MNILQFIKESSCFVVEFVPDDSKYDKLIHTLYVDLINSPNMTQEEMLEKLSLNSPQHYWETQEATRNIDTSVAESLVEQVIDSQKTSEILANYVPPSSPPLPENNQVTPDLDQFIQSILNEQPAP